MAKKYDKLIRGKPTLWFGRVDSPEEEYWIKGEHLTKEEIAKYYGEELFDTETMLKVIVKVVHKYAKGRWAGEEEIGEDKKFLFFECEKEDYKKITKITSFIIDESLSE